MVQLCVVCSVALMLILLSVGCDAFATAAQRQHMSNLIGRHSGVLLEMRSQIETGLSPATPVDIGTCPFAHACSGEGWGMAVAFSTDSQFNNITTNRSFTTYKRHHDANGTALTTLEKTEACAVRGLQTHWESKLQQGQEEIRWQYFASFDTKNIMFYPSFDWRVTAVGPFADCPGNYDPTTRQWFVSSIAGPRTIILLIDTSGASDLELEKRMSIAILETVGFWDHVNVIAYDVVSRPFNSFLLRATHQVIQDIKAHIQGLAVRPNAGGRVDLAAAVSIAMTQFERNPSSDGNSNGGEGGDDGGDDGGNGSNDEEGSSDDDESNVHPRCAVTLVVFGGGSHTVPGVQSPVHVVTGSQVVSPVVIAYKFPIQGDQPAPWAQAMACATDGIWFDVNSNDDIAEGARRYVNFASSFTNNDVVRLSPPYDDALGQGRLTTAALPVTGPRNGISEALLGVVAFDISMHDFTLNGEISETDVQSFFFSSTKCPARQDNPELLAQLRQDQQCPDTSDIPHISYPPIKEDEEVIRAVLVVPTLLFIALPILLFGLFKADWKSWGGLINALFLIIMYPLFWALVFPGLMTEATFSHTELTVVSTTLFEDRCCSLVCSGCTEAPDDSTMCSQRLFSSAPGECNAGYHCCHERCQCRDGANVECEEMECQCVSGVQSRFCDSECRTCYQPQVMMAYEIRPEHVWADVGGSTSAIAKLESDCDETLPADATQAETDACAAEFVERFEMDSVHTGWYRSDNPSEIAVELRLYLKARNAVLGLGVVVLLYWAMVILYGVRSIIKRRKQVDPKQPPSSISPPLSPSASTMAV